MTMLLDAFYVGYDPREVSAYAVTRHTLRRHCGHQMPIRGIILQHLMSAKMYTRPIEYRSLSPDRTVLWDVISGAPMSTQFAISRFFVPYLASTAKTNTGWVGFMDCDMLVRRDLTQIELDPQYAIYCVKHDHKPESITKMDGQVQQTYLRKNWSSVMIFNIKHPSMRKLTMEVLNTVPGRDLHRFCWLKDNEIGELPVSYNWLVNYSDPTVRDPHIVHFTEGTPEMAGYENVPYADEWRDALIDWAR